MPLAAVVAEVPRALDAHASQRRDRGDRPRRHTPDLNLSNVRTTLLGADETTAAMVGQADTPFGPTAVSATIEILQSSGVRTR